MEVEGGKGVVKGVVVVVDVDGDVVEDLVEVSMESDEDGGGVRVEEEDNFNDLLWVQRGSGNPHGSPVGVETPISVFPEIPPWWGHDKPSHHVITIALSRESNIFRLDGVLRRERVPPAGRM